MSMDFGFTFYSSENNEPVHIHVEKAEANAKYWLEPKITVEYSYGFGASQSKAIRTILDTNRDKLIAAWNEYFR